MKTRFSIIFIVLLMLVSSLTACSPVQTTQTPATNTPIPPTVEPTALPTATFTPSPTPVPIKPLDLLDESLNPFSQLIIPEDFTLDSINLWINPETQGYNYLFISNKNLQDTINLVGAMVTFQDDATLEMMQQDFQQYGKLRFESEYDGQFINVDIEKDEDQITVQFKYYFDEENWTTYQPYLEKNFNEDIFPVMQPSLFDIEPDRTEITIKPDSDRIHSLKQYSLDETTFETYKENLTSESFMDGINKNTLNPASISVEGNRTVVNGEQNKIDFSIDMHDNEIWIFESVSSLEENLINYIEPSVVSGSLLGFGFDTINISEGVAGYKDGEYDDGFMIMVKKTEWGADQDVIEVVSKLLDKYHLTYRYNDKTFHLDMANGEHFLQLIYDPATGEISPANEGFSIDFLSEGIQELTGMEYEQGVKWLVSRTTDYANNQFNYTMDELFEAPLQ